MTFTPTRLVSIHGNRLGLNTTGALLVIDKASTMYAAVVRSSADVVQGSTAMMFAQGGVTRRTHDTAASSTMLAYGFVTLTSGTATAVALELSEPVAGVQFDLHIDTSASLVTLGASSTLIHFASTLQVAAADRTTALFTSTGTVLALAGGVISMRGVSTAQWQITNWTGPAWPSSGESGLHHTVG